MDQSAVCPRCGSIVVRGATWCPSCGYSPGSGVTAAPRLEDAGGAKPSLPVTPPGPQNQWQSNQPPPNPWQPNPWQPNAWRPNPWQPNQWQPGAPQPQPWYVPTTKRNPVPPQAVILSVIGVIAVVGAGLLFTFGIAPGGSASGTTPPPGRPTLRSFNPVSVFANGTHVVGIDIPPGTYRGFSGGGHYSYPRCTGIRVGQASRSGSTAAPRAVVEYDSAVITIEPTDVAFISSGCNRWTNELKPITDSRTSFSDGYFIVGLDIDPGTYTTQGGLTCRSERLAGFSWLPQDSIEVGQPTNGSLTVTIQPTDKGFSSFECGAWALQTAGATPVASTPAPTQRSFGPVTEFGDGTYFVGRDIPPGTYRGFSTSPHSWPNCTGQRMSELSASGSTAAARAAVYYDSAVITIEPGDAAFISSNCDHWTNELKPITESRTSFGDGFFIVGLDIAPGTYTSKGGTSCSSERLAGFSWLPEDKIEEAWPANGRLTVTIQPTDKGFSSFECGSWTKTK
jgi:hypothetical protein